MTIPKRAAREAKVQLSIRIGADLAKKLKLFAVAKDTRMQDVVETGIRAVLGEKSAG
jgi:hypothetical protein